MRRIFLALIVLAMIAPHNVSAQVPANAVCATNMVTGAASEARFFCEPMNSIGFVQFDQFVAGLMLLENNYPDMIEVIEIGQSVNGLPIYFVEVTNEKSSIPREEKLQIGYSASIHANEAAGREGMIRVIEDLAAGVGLYGKQMQSSLDQLIINVWFPNPDSWAAGDYFSSSGIAGIHDPSQGVGFARENALGVDLNREFPNPGWIEPNHTPMSEPESRAVVEELRFSGRHSNLAAGTDLHGMINSANMMRMIIPNQDYDFRRMVLIVDQLHLTQERVEENPSFAEWTTVDAVVDEALGLGLPVCAQEPTGLVANGCLDASAVHDKPMQWGARWDMIGYTDTGFTSDYLTLSPRSPTGGMGAVGTITEFAYSHMVPDNKYVAKLTDMHVAGVREIVRTQIEMALRLDSPTLAGTGPVGYLPSEVIVSSKNDPNAYVAPNGKEFNKDDDSARFEFNQVPYEVVNTQFWADLNKFSADPITPLQGDVTVAKLSSFDHFAVSDRAYDSLDAVEKKAIHAWVQDGGHLILTDSAIQLLEDEFGYTAKSQCVYVGHSNIQDLSHPLLAGVDWEPRVTAEASATGFKANSGSDFNYPEWGVVPTGDAMLQVIGTTTGANFQSASCVAETTESLVTMGSLVSGKGSVDFIGGALPTPTQAYDHRYGLSDYSVSALTYWFFMNSLGGHVDYKEISEPFVPSYDYDPLYGKQSASDSKAVSKKSPGIAFVGTIAIAGIAAALRRRN